MAEEEQADVCGGGPDSGAPPLRRAEAEPTSVQEIGQLLASVARNTAKALREAKKGELERLLGALRAAVDSVLCCGVLCGAVC